ncbi:hypothetical protein SAMN05421819_2255 [Bryocella elongata]|uniref:Uncharacterized protein n=1 Tax=Bryocella elongata TaxID=863522 RepID=A0A1H5YED4_9BACT|nr:DUF2007 domain-containing protein [Bryocella elongata]SEG22112.1 hypothetical protein SAMN05421819_2255 [Bryocella elongata]
MPDINTDREWQRLLALYADKADEELHELHDRRHDLTELAQQALDRTIQQRGLEPVPADGAEANSVSRGDLAIGEAKELEPGEQSLITFRDGLEASQAIAALRDAEVPHRITERMMRYIGGDSRTLLELIVERTDADAARDVLQRALGLFPPAEGDDDMGDGQDYAPLGEFTPAQAVIVKAALEGHGLPYVVDQDEEDAAAPIRFNVAADRVDEAFDVMEQIAEALPE